MKKILLLQLAAVLAVVMCLSVLVANAGVHAMVSSCANNGNGTAYSPCAASSGAAGPYNTLAITYVRGDTYCPVGFFGLGTTTVLNQADSGTSPITFLAPTATNICSTLPGFTIADVAQTEFGPLQFQSDYWTFNGAYRGSGTGNPWIDWRTGYGFKIVNNIGTGVPTNTSAAIQVGIPGNNQPQNGVQIEYTEVFGSDDHLGLYQDMGIQFTGGASTGDYAGFNYVHDWGASIGITGDSTSSYNVEYNYAQNNESTGSLHAEIFGIRAWNGGASSNINIRYNIAENSNGTAIFASPGATITPSNIAIYRNIVLYNSAETNPSYSCAGTPTTCGNGDGWLSLWNFTNWTGYLYVFNNTISSMDQPGGACDHDWGSQTGQTIATMLFYNNVYYNCKQNVNPPGCPGTCATYHEDYNSYFDMPQETNDTGANVQITASNPFVNVNYTVANANNFALAGGSDPTNAGFNTSSLLPGNSTDMLGNVMNVSHPSRGALNFASSSSASPPTATFAAGTFGGEEATVSNPNSGTTVVCVGYGATTPATNGSGTGCTTGFALQDATSYFNFNTSETINLIAGVAGETDSTVTTYTQSVGTQTILSSNFAWQCGTGQLKNCQNPNPPPPAVWPTSIAMPKLLRLHDSGTASVWSSVQPSNGSSYTWTNLDAYLDLLAAHAATGVLTNTSVPCWDGPQFVLTGVTISGGNAIYAYSSFVGQTMPSSSGTLVKIAGFSNAGNNLSITTTAISGGTTGTITVAATTQVAETHAATGYVGCGVINNYPAGTNYIPTDLTTSGSTTFNNFITTYVQHCNSNNRCVATYIKGYDMWNEWNLTVHWTGTYQQLYQMIAPAVAIIRANVPNAVIIAPSVTPFGAGYGTELTNYLNYENSQGRVSDIVNWHYYLTNTGATIVTPEVQWANVVSGAGNLLAAQAAVTGFAVSPFMDTEMNFNGSATLQYSCPSATPSSPPTTYSPADCASMIPRIQLLHDSNGAAGAWWYYGNWTIGQNTSYSTAYYQMEQLLTGGNFTSACAISSGTTWTCNFHESNGTTAQWVWTTSEAANQTYTVPSNYTQFRDLNGGVTPVVASTAMAITNMPVMLEQAGGITPPVLAPATVTFADNYSTDRIF